MSARQNGNNAKLSPPLNLKLKLKLCWAGLSLAKTTGHEVGWVGINGNKASLSFS